MRPWDWFLGRPQTLWRWLLCGSDEMILPKSWLLNRSRVRAYEAYTFRQLQQGAIVSDVAAMRRRAFWAAHEAKRADGRPALPFRKRA